VLLWQCANKQHVWPAVRAVVALTELGGPEPELTCSGMGSSLHQHLHLLHRRLALRTLCRLSHSSRAVSLGVYGSAETDTHVVELVHWHDQCGRAVDGQCGRGLSLL
jgi:hypothetical protein